MQSLSPAQFLVRRYHDIVFAGGGNRCWWQAGLVELLAQHPSWQARRLVGASAGAGIATAFATGRLQDSLAAAVERFAATPRNVEWRELLKGRRPFMLPRIYPDWIDSFLDAADFSRLQQSALKVQVAITRPVHFLPTALSTALALALYASEKFWLKRFHARLPHYLGLRAEYLDLASSSSLIDARTLLLASGAAVPITPTHRVGGRPALDGGFYDSVPLPPAPAAEGDTLILLTRHRPELPRIFLHEHRVYLQPTRPVAAINMDCTNPGAVRKTYEQGRQEAAALLAG
jgi:predicted acylesterase/phospholipase RssA